MRYRLKKNGIVYELIEPTKDKNLKKGIIVFSGLPNQPRNDDFGDNLASEGYYVLQPRYIGNWESYGKFSLKNCIKTVVEAEKLFSGGEAKECWGNKEIKWDIKEIYLLSSSFGSSIVLSALSKIKTKKIICLCPLTNLYKHHSEKDLEEQDLKGLGKFIQRGFENAFRGFDLKEWALFIKGESEVNPFKYLKQIKNKKILLLHGNKDNVVNISRTSEYYNKIKNDNEVEFKVYPGIGHGKNLKEASFDFVLNWIKNN